MPLKTLDTVLTQQVFLTGRVTDAFTGFPVSGATVDLVYRDQPDRPYALGLRRTPDSGYAFFGEPRTAFPELTPPDVLELQLVVAAPRYTEQRLDLTLTAANLALAMVTRQIAGVQVEVPLRINLPLQRDFALLPLPVHLAGRVVSRDDPSVPVANAVVRVQSPQPRGPVTTNAAGFFTLQDLPVAPEISFEVTATGFDPLVETFAPDYGVPLNQHSFALEPS
jgi:carboxypeptidase family protein